MADTKTYAIQCRMALEKEFFPKGVTSDMIRLLDRVQKMVEQSMSAGYRMAKEKEPLVAEDWSNNACLGYAILGAKGLKYSDEQITQLVSSMRTEFDWETIDEAKQAYEKSP